MKKIYLFAFIVAILTAFSVFSFASSLQKKSMVKTLPVVVAVKQIPENTVVSAEMVAVKQLPASAVHNLALKKATDIVGKAVSTTVEADEQILSSKIVMKGKGGLSYDIPVGKRAITIQASEITGVAFNIKKGDRVDVLATVIAGNVAAKAPTTITAVQNILVLDVGTPKKADDKNQNGSYASVTLAASPEEALRISYIITDGKPVLVLRNVIDNEISPVSSYSPTY